MGCNLCKLNKEENNEKKIKMRYPLIRRKSRHPAIKPLIQRIRHRRSKMQ